MKHLPSLATLALLAALSMPAVPALGAYTQEASTFSAGGGESSSGSYTNLGVIGQPGIIGSSSGGTYTANHGFLSVLGDGFKILYPVIAATPGTLTFSVMAGSSGNQQLSISNTGGSTLNWTVTKASPDPGSIFSFTPGSGTTFGSVADSVTVSANAAGLAPGRYSNSLSISAAGIEQTAAILMNLTVTPSSYTLAVTLKLATPLKGGGTVSSVSAPGISCIRDGGALDVTCQADFAAGSTVTLRQTPGGDSQMATWGAPGCGTQEDCQFTMTANQGSEVIFPYSFMTRLASLPPLTNGFDSLVEAYGSAGLTDTINARAVTITEGAAGSEVLLNSPKTINLVGGLDKNYAPAGGFTTLHNVLKIKNGQLNIKGGLKLLGTP
jgi:hypothetical protein